MKIKMLSFSSCYTNFSLQQTNSIIDSLIKFVEFIKIKTQFKIEKKNTNTQTLLFNQIYCIKKNEILS
jgi:hypothetical protein